jgi:hypothetical protein
MDERLKFLITADNKASAVFSRIKTDLNGVQAGASALGAVFGGLGGKIAAGLSITAIAAMTQRTIDGLDALNDLADATGASIENLSALEDIAVRTGTSFDTAGDAVVRMNKALADAKPGSDQAAAFKALGLSVEELKRLDPVQAFQKLAVALSAFANDGNKARIVQELFGKSLKEVAPLLKDVAEAGQLNATVTKEQAEAAEAFNKQMFSLQKNTLDVSRTLAGPLIAAVNELFDVLSGKGAGKISEVLAVPLQAVTVLGGNVSFVLRGIAVEIGGIYAQAAAVARLDFSGAARIGDMMKNDAATARQEFDAWERRIMALGTASQASYSNEGRNAARALPGLPDLGGKPDLAAAKKAATERIKLAEFAAEQLVKLEEIIAQETVEAWSYVNKQVMEQDEARAEAAKLQWQQVFDSIDAEQDRAIEEGRLFLEAERAGKQAIETSKDIGLVFASAASDAIREWRGVKDLIKSIGLDIAQIAIKKAITDPIGKFIGDNLDVSLGSIFGALPKFASGIDYVPRDMPAIVHRGERIVPAAQNRMGGGGLTYSPVIHIDSRSDRAQVGALVAQAVQQGNLQMLQHLQAQGVA